VNHRLVAISSLVLYLVLAIGNCLAKRPRADEAYFAIPALNLATRGFMGTTILEKSGTPWLEGLERRTYWVMPLHLVLQAGWYKVAGFGLFSMRILSVAWGLVLLASLYRLLVELFEDKNTALMGAVLTAGCYEFLMITSDGRMDAMCAALNFMGYAVYLALRKQHFGWAILLSQGAVVAAGLTHPNGILGFAGLAFLTFYFDRARLEWRHAAIALIPYAIGGTAFGWYVLQDPDLFVTQFSGNARDAGRLRLLATPWQAFWLEMTERYFGHFSGFSPMAPKVLRVKIVLTLTYLAALALAAGVPIVRQRQGTRVLLILTAIYFVILSVTDGQKQYIYLIHMVPLLSALLGVVALWCWARPLAPRWVLALGLAGFLLLHLGGAASRVAQNTYSKNYMGAVEFLRPHAASGQQIMGSAELGFALGFTANLVDDYRLGYYSGKRPALIVVDDRYRQQFDAAKVKRIDVYRHVTGLLSREYSVAFDRAGYTVYESRKFRNSLPESH